MAKEESNLQVDKFKKEYTKPEFTIKNMSFKFSKLPAIKGSKLFLQLVEKLVDGVDVKRDSNPSGSANAQVLAMIIDIIKGGLSGLNDGFLEERLMPMMFETLAYSRDGSKDSKGSTGESGFANVQDNIAVFENYVGFEDIIELILRGVCYHFLPALLGKLQDFGLMTKA